MPPPARLSAANGGDHREADMVMYVAPPDQPARYLRAGSTGVSAATASACFRTHAGSPRQRHQLPSQPSSRGQLGARRTTPVSAAALLQIAKTLAGDPSSPCNTT